MDEEQSTKKWQKTKVAFSALGVTAGAVVAVPVIWGMYAYGKTSELAFKVTQTAFNHPWMTAGLLAGGMFYASNTGDINDKIQEYASNTQQSVAEYRIDSLSEKIEELEHENKTLERNNTYLATQPPSNNGPPPPALEQRLRSATNKDFFLGLAAGVGGTLLGLGGYAHFARSRSRIRVVHKQ